MLRGDLLKASGRRRADVEIGGRTVHLSLQPNPSHLEAVNPVVAGKVSKVSAYIFTDERTGHAYYRADAALDDTILAELEGRRLVPGMPVEAFISTEDRSALSYFVKPMADYFTRAFRER